MRFVSSLLGKFDFLNNLAHARVTEKKPVVDMLHPSITDRNAELVHDALQSFRPAIVQQLQSEKLQIKLRSRFRALMDMDYRGKRTNGRFVPRAVGSLDFRPRVHLSESADKKLKRGTILHELYHAIDWLKSKSYRRGLSRFFGSLQYYSMHDDALKNIYVNWLSSVAIDDATWIYNRVVDENPQFDGSHSIKGTAIREGHPINFTYICPKESPNGKASVLLKNYNGFKPLRTAAVTVGCTALALITGSIFFASSPVTTVLYGIAGIHSLLYAAHSLSEFKLTKFVLSFQRKIALDSGEKVEVKRIAGQTFITLPQSRSHTDFLWSRYAERKNQVCEYIAEGVRYFLDSKETRQRLQKKDPKLYAYIEKLNLVPENS